LLNKVLVGARGKKWQRNGRIGKIHCGLSLADTVLITLWGKTMSEQLAEKQQYMAYIRESEDRPNTFLFEFSPKKLPGIRANGGLPNRQVTYSVVVQSKETACTFDWSESPDAPGPLQQELEQEVVHRLAARQEWIDRVSSLVAQVDAWGKDLGWSTRRIEKRLEDSYIGKHSVPALLMQEETCRIMLEPVGRSAPGVNGVVDLYLMPAYDDIATMYYYDGQWHLHCAFPGDAGPTANTREAAGKVLSIEALQEALEEMKKNAV
jgi:hypothetical protein